MKFSNFLRKKKKQQQMLKKVADILTFESSTLIGETQVVRLNKLKQKSFFKYRVYGCQVENVTYLALVTPDERIILKKVYWDYNLIKEPFEKEYQDKN